MINKIIKKKKIMKSKIMIDLDEDNQPIIKIDYFYSEDVRDKMVKRFLETFETGCWARFQYLNNGTEYVNSNAKIRPLTPEELKLDLKKIQEFVIEEKTIVKGQ